MCGIAAILAKDPISLDRTVFETMTHSLSHRGPDGHGFFFDPRCMLGHRRLSIIDVEGGQQPIFNEDKSLVITFNGEIYNYLELRRMLQSRGHTFKTKSDTEVLIHGHEEFGPDFVNQLYGMFAYVLWDRKKNKGLIVRDRLGVKPLFYTHKDGMLVVASEMKAILALPTLDRKANYEALSSYLTFRTVLQNETVFKNIYSLEPGHYVEFENGELKTTKYWDLPTDPQAFKDRQWSNEQYIERSESLLKAAIERRLMSEVPLGAYLSGGLDSSLLVALMSSMVDGPLKTFSIGFEEEGYSELGFAKIVSKRFNTDHCEVLLNNKQYFEMLDQLILHRDSPLSIPHEVALYQLSKVLKKDVTVVLSGEGADELFGGYGRVLRSPMDLQQFETYNRLPVGLRDLYARVHSEPHQFKKRSAVRNDLDYFFEVYNWMPFSEKLNLFSTDLRREINEDRDLVDFLRSKFDGLAHLDTYQKYFYFFQKYHLRNLLERLDLMSMAASVEARVPFVDHAMVEEVFTYPTDVKMRWKSGMHKALANFYFADKASEWLDTNKFILRKLSQKYLPREIYDRKKLGFPVPLDNWFSKNMMAMAHELLLSSKAKNRGIYDIKRVETLLQNRQNLNFDFYGKKIWMLINIELWHRHHIDR